MRILRSGIQGPRASFLLPLALLAVSFLFLLGAGEAPLRVTVAAPNMDGAPVPETVYGEATLGAGASDEAIKGIKAPSPPEGGPWTLEECIALALKASPALDSAQQGEYGATWSLWEAKNDTGSGDSSKAGNGLIVKDPEQIRSLGLESYSWRIEPQAIGLTPGAKEAALAIADLQKKAAAIRTIITREDVTFKVKDAYFSVLLSEKTLKRAEEMVSKLESNLERNESYSGVGIVRPNVVRESELKLSEAKRALEKLKSDNIVKKGILNILLGRAPEEPIEIADVLSFSPFPLTVDNCLLKALQNNPELLFLRNRAETASKVLNFAENGFYPQFSPKGTKTAEGKSKTAKNSSQSNSSGPIEKSKIQLNQAINDLTIAENELKVKVTEAYQELLSGGADIRSLSDDAKRAEEYVLMIDDYYANQIVTNKDVLEAYDISDKVHYEEILSLYNYNLAWAAMERDLGENILKRMPR